MSWIEGIDVSVWQGSILEGSWKALWDAGQRVAVVGSAHPRPNTYAHDNLERAKRQGFTLATYAVVYAGVPSAQTIATAKQMCGSFWSELAFVGVDCETPDITEAQIHGMVTAIEAEGLRPVIYTARWWWRDHFGDSQAFKHLPLWNAYYDSDPDIDFPSTAYGGWTLEKVIGEQYAGSVNLAGVTVDRNSFLKEFVMPQTAPTEAQRLLALSWLAAASKAVAENRLPLTQQVKDWLKLLAS